MRKLFLLLMTLMACTLGLQAQTRTIHGTVVDAANNEPLIGATVMPIGGGQGVAADLDGNFTLSVPSNVKKATVSYVGYTSQTVDLSDGMTVKLQSSSQSLDDLVVVAYGTASKESLTGSVAVVGSKEIEDRPVTSVTSALEGNAPGVQVNNSTGTPGSSPSIRIRGYNSINGSNAPLYVVDGVPFSGSINDLNPADIESMSVLKDAASSALYGNRGANGVVLITTKKAKNSGNVDVNLTIRQGMYTRGLPFYDRLSANPWMQMQYNARVNGDGRLNNPYAPTEGEAIQKARKTYAGNTFIRQVVGNNIYGVPGNQLFDPETGQFIGGDPLPGYTDTDWWDAVSRTGYRQEYNVNAAAATDKFNIFTSIGYLKENGYTLGTDFDRFTARVNANFNPTKYLKFGVNLAATQQESETGDVSSSQLDAINNPFLTQFYTPVQPYYQHDEQGNIIYDQNGNPLWNTASYNQGTNVAWEMRLNQNNYSKTAIDAMAYATAVLPYGFELTVRGQMYRDKNNMMSFSNDQVGSQQGSGMLQKEYDVNKSHTIMETLTWDHQYGDHHVDVLLDHENYNIEQSYDYIQKSGLQMPGNIDLNRFANLELGISGAGQERLESYLGRARYNYNQQYFLEASIRRDGSSRFAKNHRWGTFWSVGGSWIITKEKFMEQLTWLNYLKLRASYGSVGNNTSAGVYSYRTYYDWAAYQGGQISTLVPAFLGTPNLKWEATKTFDLALEGSLFNDRLSFTVGYFNKTNSDLLFSYVLPASMGTLMGSGSNPSIVRNIGSMLNYGWELQFGVDIIRSKDWKWDFSIDATFLKNKVKKLPNGHDLPAQNLFINKSLYQLKCYTFAGVDQITGQSMYEICPTSPDLMSFDSNGVLSYDEETFNQRVDAARKDKDHVFIEQNGKYYTSNTAYATQQLHGDMLPTVYGSFGTNVSWKGINLGLLFTYSLGGKFIDSNYANLMSGAGSSVGALHKDILNSWTSAPEGITEDSPNRIDPNGVPILDYLRSQWNNTTSSRFITNASYLNLKNINISYDIPASWSKALLLKNINIGASIDNVFLITKRKGVNPQYGNGTGQGAYYVPARVFSFQLSAKF